MTWYPILGWGTFWVGLVIGIILFAKSKKLYPVIYLLSVALYIFTAGFLIDVFALGKLGIMLTLFVSAVIFMLLGWYFSRIFKAGE